KEIGTEASSATQTYPVTLSIKDIPLELSLLPGMTGQATMPQPQTDEKQIFILPKSAIFTDNLHLTYVWIVDPNSQTVHKQEVKLEPTHENCVHVLDGLKNGDWVVTAGTSFLSEGQKVIPNAKAS